MKERTVEDIRAFVTRMRDINDRKRGEERDKDARYSHFLDGKIESYDAVLLFIEGKLN